jgi:DNA processing protein
MIGVSGFDPAASRPSQRRMAEDGDLPYEPADRDCWLALSLLPGVGPAAFAQALRRFGSARRAWAAGPAWLGNLQRHRDESQASYERLDREGPRRVSARLEAALAACGARAVIAADPGYPAALHDIWPRPPVLYVRGELACLEAPTVAVVGTRRPSGYGRAAATEIADELARAGATVVSGLALGIDGEAHAAALAAGGRTVAVLPSPINRVYPPRHAELAERLVAARGALISEVAPGQPIGKPDFARRNRIIAALALAVVVVEAPDRSGALLTAAAAAGLGREVHAVPGPIHAAQSRGCNRLIADQHASLVTSAVGLLHQIGVTRNRAPISVQELSDSEGVVLGQLLRRPGSIEELIGRTHYPTPTIASSLTLLEARGLVTSYGGATFHPTQTARRIGRLPGSAAARRPAAGGDG